jgi:glycosyltransferase involved in cell wall biosynthesis
MNIAFIATRLAGLDGVSLGTTHWATVLQRLGHRVFYCAGELSERRAAAGRLVPEMHFKHPEAVWTHDHAFGYAEAHPDLRGRIQRLAGFLRAAIADFVRDFKIDMLLVEQALTIPMQLPLGVALREYIAETRISALAHHHDFYWERDRFRMNCIPDILDAAFPPADLPTLRHAVINSFQVEALRERSGLEATLVPNVWDYDAPPPTIDGFNADFRAAFDIAAEDVLILQPTRIVRRKAIERAIELVRLLGDPRHKFVLTGTTGDEPDDYRAFLMERIAEAGLEAQTRWIGDRLDDHRGERDGQEVYSLWDAYLHADFITYPSEIEGFGNALLETVYFRKPFMTNRYPVYVKDIAPTGLDCIEIDGMPTEETANAVRALLDDPDRRRAMTEHNFAVCREHFSFAVLEEKLRGLLASL